MKRFSHKRFSALTGVAVIAMLVLSGCAIETSPYRPALSVLSETTATVAGASVDGTSIATVATVPVALRKVAAKKKAPLPVVVRRYSTRGTGSGTNAAAENAAMIARNKAAKLAATAEGKRLAAEFARRQAAWEAGGG